MPTNRKLPIGIQTFREIREDGHYYVDKTPFIQRLVAEGKHYFLSRPRRFGKSLLLDTIKELFEANEPLFRGLAIHHDWDWSAPHPVLRLSFGSGNVDDMPTETLLFPDRLSHHHGRRKRRRQALLPPRLPKTAKCARTLTNTCCAPLRDSVPQTRRSEYTKRGGVGPEVTEDIGERRHLVDARQPSRPLTTIPSACYRRWLRQELQRRPNPGL